MHMYTCNNLQAPKTTHAHVHYTQVSKFNKNNIINIVIQHAVIAHAIAVVSLVHMHPQCKHIPQHKAYLNSSSVLPLQISSLTSIHTHTLTMANNLHLRHASSGLHIHIATKCNNATKCPSINFFNITHSLQQECFISAPQGTPPTKFTPKEVNSTRWYW